MLEMFFRTLNAVKRVFHTSRVKRICASCGEELRVNGKTIISPNTHLGHHVNINGMIINGKGEVYIGNYFHSGAECLIITQNHNYDNGSAIPYDDSYIVKSVDIKDNVWLGSRVTILPGVTINEGAIIQAGSVVTQDIPYCGIAGGAPAVVFKYRDIEHYEKLKAEGRFF